MEVGFKQVESFPLQHCCFLPEPVGQQCGEMQVRSNLQRRKNASSRTLLQGDFALHVERRAFCPCEGLCVASRVVQRDGNDLSMPPTSKVTCFQGITSGLRSVCYLRDRSI